MKWQLTGYLLLALAASLVANAFLAWQWAESGAECDAEQVIETGKANTQVRVEEAERDGKLDEAAAETKADATAAVRAAKEDTHERAEAIDRVPAGAGCAAPVGLPPLDAAVDQANAAAGH